VEKRTETVAFQPKWGNLPMKMISSIAVEFGAAVKQCGRRKSTPLITVGLLACTALSTPAWAQASKPDAAEAPPASEAEIVVTGSLNALPLGSVGTIFGFDKTIVETPRSTSSISAEQIERFGVTDIYDLVAQAPGTFTNSFFGVGGALDIRGTPGEVYFRGVRRLDNPGNYPTPIGASERIDIVRGPASPIYGPSKTGGYMNFVPRTGRVADGKFLSAPEGEISFTTGSWSKAVLTGQVRGPAKIGGQEFGYSLYAEVEDSGSYYRNMNTRQTIIQAAFDTDLSSNLRLEFGGMYHKYNGQQNGGWNRLTQDLVDNGRYISGQPTLNLDTNGSGSLSVAELVAAGGLFGFAPFFPGGPSTATAASFTGSPFLAITPTGTVQLSRRNTLTGPNDKLNNTAKTAYLDLIFDAGDGLEIKNQLFYDGYTNLNENAYGFSQFADSYVIEDKIVISKKFETSVGKIAFQLSPSIRYTNFFHGDDFTYEYFHRVDLTVGYTPNSTRLLSTQSGTDFSSYTKGYSTDIGLAGLVNLDFNFGLDVTAGIRYDSIYASSADDKSKITLRQLILNEPFPPGPPPYVYDASDSKGSLSWTLSANYKLPFGLVPYATISKQSVLITGQGAEVNPNQIATGAFVSASKLYEGGIKGSWLNGALYAAVSVYKQQRTDFSSQSVTVNQAVETKGIEAEFRWSVNKHLLLTGAYTKTKVYSLGFLNDANTRFSFFGVEDLRGINPALYFGGQPGGTLPVINRDSSRRAGIPANIFAGTATYAFDNGLAFAASATHVESVFSGQSQAVRLPAYTLVDLSASFKTGPWLLRAVCKNCTDARYFRANFTELFGSTIALPEKPRSFQVTAAYKF